jgi:hypothetical protein
VGAGPSGLSLDAARAAHGDAFVAARTAGDVEAMASAALQLAAVQRFGGPSGRTPALLHEAYLAASDLPVTRARLAAALARSWVYGNDAFRGAPFAVEAVELAAETGDPTLLADALDAELATCWGPDDLTARLRATARLQDVAAHVDDVRTRLDAHLWRLTTALETLDIVCVHRQLAGLDLLADETGSSLARYFAITRRAMHAIVVDDLDRARGLADAGYELGSEIGVADAFAVYHEQLGEIGRHAGDTEALAVEAALAEDYGLSHGVQSIVAVAAVLWLDAGVVDRAARLALHVAGGGFAVVPYDVDWMLTVAKITDVAAGAGLTDIAREGVRLMSPYAGRGVVNAGAVVFVGVTDDFLWRGARAIGDDRADGWRAAAAAAYRRMDARWWLGRVHAPDTATPDVVREVPQVRPPHAFDLRPVAGQAVWSVGPADAAQLIPDMKGLHYLRALVQRPGVEISALDLVAMVAGHGTAVRESALGPQVDRRALAAYRQRLREIDEELEQAHEWADNARAEGIERERDALLREVAAATGLGGRVRTAGGNVERARVAVRKAIAAALDRIETADPATARLLRRSVHTGRRCRYDPDPDAPVEWQVAESSSGHDAHGG